MDSLFDPSRFIEAERAEQSQAIAAACRVREVDPTTVKPAENCHSGSAPIQTIATIATFAGEALEKSIWQAGPELLARLARPSRMGKLEWDRLVRTTRWIADDWAATADAAGWDPLEFYGSGPDPYRSGYQDGLIKLVLGLAEPAAVTAIGADHAEITVRGGVILRYRHFGPRGQVFLWDADWMKEGP